MKNPPMSPKKPRKPLSPAKAKHFAVLEVLGNNGSKGEYIYKKLRTVERRMCQSNEDLCNIPNHEPRHKAVKAWAVNQVKNLFGHLPDGFFINTDPRGYALKLDNEKVQIQDAMQKDWGGYGILAPEF